MKRVHLEYIVEGVSYQKIPVRVLEPLAVQSECRLHRPNMNNNKPPSKLYCTNCLTSKGKYLPQMELLLAGADTGFHHGGK